MPLFDESFSLASMDLLFQTSHLGPCTFPFLSRYLTSDKSFFISINSPEFLFFYHKVSIYEFPYNEADITCRVQFHVDLVSLISRCSSGQGMNQFSCGYGIHSMSHWTLLLRDNNQARRLGDLN